MGNYVRELGAAQGIDLTPPPPKPGTFTWPGSSAPSAPPPAGSGLTTTTTSIPVVGGILGWITSHPIISLGIAGVLVFLWRRGSLNGLRRRFQSGEDE